MSDLQGNHLRQRDTQYGALANPVLDDEAHPKAITEKFTGKSRKFAVLLLPVIAALILVAGFLLWSNHYPADVKNLSAVMSVCENAKYRSHTLKMASEKALIAMLGDNEGQSKFEASDVIQVGEYFYAVCDSSWSLLRVARNMPSLSKYNQQIGSPAERGAGQYLNTSDTDDSGYEALFYDSQENLFHIVRESVQVQGQTGWHAVVQEFQLAGPDGGIMNPLAPMDDPAMRAMKLDKKLVRECATDFEFQGASKGFEGAVAVRSEAGELYMLALCEGNWCDQGKRGRDKGNGRAVLMRKEAHTEQNCTWVTERVLSVPSIAFFEDYASIALSGDDVVIASQATAKVWLGKLKLTPHRSAAPAEPQFFLDPASVEFEDGGKVLDYPRDAGCRVQYCNVEGVHFVQGTDEKLLVAVSDRMKRGGKQDYRCLEKDQSMHLFALP